MCLVSYTCVHCATPQTQTQWLLCKDATCNEGVFDLNHHCALNLHVRCITYHAPWPSVDDWDFSEIKRDSQILETNLNFRFAVESEHRMLFSMLSQGHLYLIACFLSTLQLMSLSFSERAIDNTWEPLPGPLSMLHLEGQHKAILASQWREGSPWAVAPALNSIGALQRAVDLVLMCPGEIKDGWFLWHFRHRFAIRIYFPPTWIAVPVFISRRFLTLLTKGYFSYLTWELTLWGPSPWAPCSPPAGAGRGG